MSSQFQMNRRAMLGSALAIALGRNLLQPSASASTHSPALTPMDFKEKLRGPIVSIPTPFRADFHIDTVGLRNMLEIDLHNHITTFDLTAGDSQYAYLSYDEIKQVARLVTEVVGGRGITIVGTGGWWLERTIDFAKYAESIGATALQVLKPRGADGNDLVNYYRRIARSTALPIVLHGNFPLPILARLADIKSVVALKEDVSLRYYINGIIHFGHRINCFSGGGLHWFLVGQPYGATAYFDSYATFAPEISLRFWHAVQKANYASEVQIIERYDHPFIENFSAPFWHATLQYFGVADRYLRPPQHSYTDAQMVQVKAFYDKLGVFPKKRFF